ncbi:MAG: hypothetical protein NC078_09115 [Ruminococcus sp.]|nr:hypothetical protein [Ruminococcus sp.]
MNMTETVNIINVFEKLGLTGDEIVTAIKYIYSSDTSLLAKLPTIPKISGQPVGNCSQATP